MMKGEMEFKEELDTLEPVIPNSWVGEDGTRHAVIIEPLMPEYLRLKKVRGKWELIPTAPF